MKAIQLGILVLILGLNATSRASVSTAEITLKGPQVYVFTPVLSPNGQFALLQASQGPDNAGQLLSVDLQTMKISTMAQLSARDEVDFKISPDSKTVVVLASQGDILQKMTVLHLDDKGQVISSDLVYDKSVAKSEVWDFDVRLTKYGDLLFREEFSASKPTVTHVVGYNLQTKTKKVLFTAPSLSLAMSLSVAPSSADHSALTNENFYFETASCDDCQFDSFYVLKTESLDVQKLKTLASTADGRINQIIADENSVSPWVVLDRCYGSKGYTRMAYNIDTAEEHWIFSDPDAKCTLSTGDFVVIRGAHLALETVSIKKNLPDTIFDLQSLKPLFALNFNSLSADGTRVLFYESGHPGLEVNRVFDFRTGVTEAAIPTISALAHPYVLSPSLNDPDFLLTEDPARGHIDLWKARKGSAPIEVGQIDRAKDDFFDPCVQTTAGAFCATREKQGDSLLLRLWNLQ